MNLHGRDAYCFECVENGNGCVRIGSRVDNDSVVIAVGFLDPVHQSTLMIGLKVIDRDTLICRGLLQQCQQICVGAGTVDVRFPYAQHIDVRSVQYQYLHFSTSRILVTVSATVPLFSTCWSANASYSAARLRYICSSFPPQESGRPSVGSREISRSRQMTVPF